MADNNNQDKKVGDGYFTSVSEADKEAVKASTINTKIKMILQLVSDADQLTVKGQNEKAKRVYVECAEAMHKMSEQVKDDPNFHAALNQKKLMIIQKAEKCTSPRAGS